MSTFSPPLPAELLAHIKRMLPGLADLSMRQTCDLIMAVHQAGIPITKDRALREAVGVFRMTLVINQGRTPGPHHMVTQNLKEAFTHWFYRYAGEQA